jgi:hypothetical protein
MAGIRRALRGMRGRANSLSAVLLAMCLVPAALTADDQLPSIPIKGTATKLSSVTYFEPPNDQKIDERLTGDEMTPLPGGLFDVKNLTIEKFDVSGKLLAVIRAPECTYAELDGIASSPGHLEVDLAGGKIHTEGDGFLWQQKDQSLAISNNVHTIIKAGFMNLIKQ